MRVLLLTVLAALLFALGFVAGLCVRSGRFVGASVLVGYRQAVTREAA